MHICTRGNKIRTNGVALNNTKSFCSSEGHKPSITLCRQNQVSAELCSHLEAQRKSAFTCLLNLLLLRRFSRVRLCRPYRKQPTRLPRPWDSPGKNTGVGCHFLLQCMRVKVKSLSRVRLLATPWTAAHQAPPSMGFSRQECWSGVPLLSPFKLSRGCLLSLAHGPLPASLKPAKSGSLSHNFTSPILFFFICLLYF